MNIFKRILLTLLLLPVVTVWAQKNATDWAAVPASELKLSEYKADPAASALVLSDYGKIYFETARKGIEVRFFRRQRLKILNTEGLDRATIAISLYTGGTNPEKVLHLKAVTVNQGGKSEEIDEKDLMVEEITETWSQAKITLPNVVVGSVIVFEYEISTKDFFNLKRWNFQNDIPVLKSELEVIIPEYFNYKAVVSGYVPLTDYKQKSGSQTFILPPEYGVMQTLEPSTKEFRYLMENVPALYEEPYMTCLNDNLASVRFELSSYQIPGTEKKMIMETWDAVAAYFLNLKDLGRQLKRTKFLKTVAEDLNTRFPDPEKRLAACFETVRDHYEWNQQVTDICNVDIASAWESGAGNSAEINLTLCALLREVGIDAVPVILSTRANGKIARDIPLAKYFNDVIVEATVNGKSWRMDATDKYRSHKTLPIRCLNGYGLALEESSSRWVALSNREKFSSGLNGIVHIQPDGGMKGNFRTSFSGLRAVTARRRISQMGEDAYATALKENKPDWEFSKIELKGVNKGGSSVQQVVDFQAPPAIAGGGRIYIDPLSGFVDDENPFGRENRNYPVDIGASVKSAANLTFIVPEGFVVEELPEAVNLKLPENGGYFRYVVMNEGNMIQISSTIVLAGPVYAPEYYPTLYEFYARAMEKQAEQIVLKKQ